MADKRRITIGVLLSKKDLDHLDMGEMIKRPDDRIRFVHIDVGSSLLCQPVFDIIIHKASDFIWGSTYGEESHSRILKELTEYSLVNKSVIFIDPLSTVLDLADRHKMLTIMDKCAFQLNGISVVIPRWAPLRNAEDVDLFMKSNFKYPVLCKAMCAGEGPGAHDMQLVFSKEQLLELKVFPCVAQEFENHDGIMYKIFSCGRSYSVFTRPSIRNFPVNGVPLEMTESILFHSHQVAKQTSSSFLNNYCKNYVERKSTDGDVLLDRNVVENLLQLISKEIRINLIGIDILISNRGSCYNLVDVNYLPSYAGVDTIGDDFYELLCEVVRSHSYVQCWRTPSS